MGSGWKIAAAAMTLAGTAGGGADAATYALDRTISSNGGPEGRAVGTITTDGTTGVLGTGNIVDFDIEVSLLGFSRRITRAGGSWSVFGEALSATETALVFDHARTDGSYAYFTTANPYFAPFYCLQANGACIDNNGPGEGVQVYNVSTRAARAGAVPFADAAVPEPAAWGVMLAGFGLVGAASRARRGRVAAA